MEAAREIRVGDVTDGRIEIEIPSVLSLAEAEQLYSHLGAALLDHALVEAGAEPIGPEPISAHDRAAF